MTSSDANDLWQPQPPALLPPWHTPERERLQQEARRFPMDEVLPVADELDPLKGEIPPSLLERLAQLGWFGITVPAEAGGLGLGVFEYCMVSEELARAWMSVASILARSQGLGTAVPDDDRRHELLGRSARGDWIGAIALSEPDAGSDLAGVSTRAVLEDDVWVVTGRKRWCGNAKSTRPGPHGRTATPRARPPSRPASRRRRSSWTAPACTPPRVRENAPLPLRLRCRGGPGHPLGTHRRQ